MLPAPRVRMPFGAGIAASVNTIAAVLLRLWLSITSGLDAVSQLYAQDLTPTAMPRSGAVLVVGVGTAASFCTGTSKLQWALPCNPAAVKQLKAALVGIATSGRPEGDQADRREDT